MADKCIVENWPGSLNGVYRVTFCGFPTRTTVTSCPDAITAWIADIEHIHLHNPPPYLLFGLAIESPLAKSAAVPVLQLYNGGYCLVIQLAQCPQLPPSLSCLFQDPKYTFIGVGIRKAAKMLKKDYQLTLVNKVDPNSVSSIREIMGRYADVVELALRILGVALRMGVDLTPSTLYSQHLTQQQIFNATITAYICFELGQKIQGEIRRTN